MSEDVALTGDTSGWVRYIEHRVGITRDAIADVFNETRKQHADDVAALRREIAAVRDAPPPLIAPPDRRLASALQKCGEELAGLKDGVEALRDGEAKREIRTKATADAVAELRKQLAELEERGESNAAATEKNLHAASRAIFNLSNSLERVHALLARLAVATDNEHVLTAVDKLHLPADEQQPSAVVLSLENLRYARSA
jgi:hypothetical protein